MTPCKRCDCVSASPTATQSKICVALRPDFGMWRAGASVVILGAERGAKRALLFGRPPSDVKPVLVNGPRESSSPPNGRSFSILSFAVVGFKIAEINAPADRDRLRREIEEVYWRIGAIGSAALAHGRK